VLIEFRFFTVLMALDCVEHCLVVDALVVQRVWMIVPPAPPLTCGSTVLPGPFCTRLSVRSWC